MIKKIVTVSVAAFFAFLISSIETSAQQQGQVLDQLRAQNFIVHNLQGRRVELNKLIGRGKPVVIDFWATWCGPCRWEIPHLLELSKQYRDQGLIVIGLTVEDPQEDRNAVKAFVNEFKMTYPVAFAPEEIYLFFNNNSPQLRIPNTLVFGPDGKLIRRLIGYNQKAGKDILTKAVDQAMQIVKQ